MNVKNYLLSVSALVILIEISRLILPKGKTKRIAEIVFSLIIIITLLSPVLKLKEISISGLNDIEFESDESFLYRANAETEELYKMEVESFLNSEGVGYERVQVNCEKSRIKKVMIFLTENVIGEENPHINSSGLEDLLSSLLNVDREAIEIVEG